MALNAADFTRMDLRRVADRIAYLRRQLRGLDSDAARAYQARLAALEAWSRKRLRQHEPEHVHHADAGVNPALRDR